ncbi:type IV pilin [Haloarchaeobius iranensis]|uniref:Flagellin (Archaellin), FlaG/FlaF family n=1 Tax=Haloarchaeobius iranensis TaxID=996166 RepID=A0A1G9T2R9_9EURY|nr:type IV pilin N-terminal domain-containing protein [Haloarchaeobius iranensis]SDM42044.1 flagellin (archaellin), FlaG/FlaF family [Haloarchaeobius iranensis]
MNFRGMLADEDALSPVIGVVLMVALTVVLSASVGVFVLGIGSQVTQQTPNAVVQYEFAVDGSGNETLTLTQEGGNPVDAQYVTVYVEGDVAWEGGSTGSNYVLGGADEWADGLEGGDSLALETNSSNVAVGDTIRIVWEKDGQSAILGERQIG